MKKLFAIITAITLFSFSVTAQANRDPRGKNRHPRLPIDSSRIQNNPNSGSHGKFHGKKKHKNNKVKMMQKLNLTDAQKQQMKSLREEYKTKIQTLKSNQNITVGQANAQLAALQTERKNKFLAVLTPQQKTQLEQLKTEKSQQMQAMQVRHLEKMKTTLNLSEQQVASIKSKNDVFKQQVQSIRNNASLTQEQKRDQVMQIKEQRKTFLKSVLTSEQFNKWQETKKQKRGRNTNS